MIEENGHRWVSGHLLERCSNCARKYGHYLEFKQASIAQPAREDLKEDIKCRGRK